MSVIKTWKCDGCGAITRAYPDEWFEISVERMARRARKNVFELDRKDSVRRHVCSVECAGLAVIAAREDVDALEIPA